MHSRAPMLALALALLGCSEPEPSSETGATAQDAGDDTGPDTGPRELEDPPEAEDDLGATAALFDSTFLGEDDAAWRTALAGAGWERMEQGSGGRSLGFKVTLVDGSAGYFKPAQSFAGARWYAEIAAFHVDRELGLDRVPPTIGRRFPLRALRRAATHDGEVDPRVAGLEADEEGDVPGAFIGWVPQRLARWRLGRGFEAQLRHDGTPLPHSPFQPPRDWRAVINGDRWPEETAQGQEPDAEVMDAEARAEASDLVLFDTLIHNVDRWGGDYTNVRRRGRGGPLIFLDNGAAFWEGEPMLGLARTRLHAIEKFRRSTIMALEALDLDRLRARMAEDPLGPALEDERHWEGLRIRRRHILRHVQRMHALHGPSVWLDPSP